MWRTAKWRKRTCVGASTVETGSCSSTVYCLAPASTGYCSSTVDLLQTPPATVHSRHLPPASTSYCSSTVTVHPASTGYYSSSLHGILFIHPNRLGCGGLLRVRFIQRQRPTTTGSCSSNPHRELFIHSQPTGSTHHASTRSMYRAHDSNDHCSSRGNPTPTGYISHGGSIGFSKQQQ